MLLHNTTDVDQLLARGVLPSLTNATVHPTDLTRNVHRRIIMPRTASGSTPAPAPAPAQPVAVLYDAPGGCLPYTRGTADVIAPDIATTAALYESTQSRAIVRGHVKGPVGVDVSVLQNVLHRVCPPPVAVDIDHDVDQAEEPTTTPHNIEPHAGLPVGSDMDAAGVNAHQGEDAGGAAPTEDLGAAVTAAAVHDTAETPAVVQATQEPLTVATAINRARAWHAPRVDGVSLRFPCVLHDRSCITASTDLPLVPPSRRVADKGRVIHELRAQQAGMLLLCTDPSHLRTTPPPCAHDIHRLGTQQPSHTPRSLQSQCRGSPPPPPLGSPDGCRCPPWSTPRVDRRAGAVRRQHAAAWHAVDRTAAAAAARQASRSFRCRTMCGAYVWTTCHVYAVCHANHSSVNHVTCRPLGLCKPCRPPPTPAHHGLRNPLPPWHPPGRAPRNHPWHCRQRPPPQAWQPTPCRFKLPPTRGQRQAHGRL